MLMTAAKPHLHSLELNRYRHTDPLHTCLLSLQEREQIALRR